MASISIIVAGYLGLIVACRGGQMVDILLLNGRIWTGKETQPWAEAIAIREEKIYAVGSNKALQKIAGTAKIIYDLKGSLVLPGFIDAHTHFLDGGFSLKRLNLKDVKSREEFIALIAQEAKKLGPGKWITHGQWDHQRLTPPELPRKEWIDPVTPKNPVLINRHDGHMALANSLALKIAGINRQSVSPPGGEIQMDSATGEPTGILTDAAIDLVARHIPEPSFDDKLEAAKLACQHALANGVTSVHDMGEATNFEVYQELARRGELNCRIRLYFPITEIEVFERLGLKGSFGSEWLTIGGLKGFIDGSLGAATALFFEPYSDQSQNFGLFHSQMYPEGIMEERIRRADRLGLQIAIHAIGDRANAVILDIMEKIIRENGPRDRRWRIEHAQHLRRKDIARMGRLALIASVQPYHLADDGCWAEKRIGPDRARTTYAFRSLLDNQVVLIAGSDWTVAPLNPLLGIWAAVTRQTVDGRHPEGWIPEEKITVEEAVKAYTVKAAYAEFSEKMKGTIEPGKWADLVILDRDIFTIPPQEILKTRVKMTFVAGQKVYNGEN
ncbi:MAG: amidohydrolase [Candidatus Aminicenantes bacterium]|nr:amidohydrolase [Candidatus Aminicenantes bacterium]